MSDAILNLGGNRFHYKGFSFEFHPYMGPTPLRKDGELRTTIPRGFWGAFEEWQNLSDLEKADTLIQAGGCVHLRLGK